MKYYKSVKDLNEKLKIILEIISNENLDELDIFVIQDELVRISRDCKSHILNKLNSKHG